jgi:rubredoxin
MLLNSDIRSGAPTSRCACSSIFKPKTAMKPVTDAAREKMPDQFKCRDCGGKKTWGMGNGSGPCSLHRLYVCHSCGQELKPILPEKLDDIVGAFMDGVEVGLRLKAESSTAEK